MWILFRSTYYAKRNMSHLYWSALPSLEIMYENGILEIISFFFETCLTDFAHSGLMQKWKIALRLGSVESY